MLAEKKLKVCFEVFMTLVQAAYLEGLGPKKDVEIMRTLAIPEIGVPLGTLMMSTNPCLAAMTAK